MFETMICLILLLAALYAWQNALRARDLARALGHDLCVKAGVQLLDQSVSLSGVGISRNAEGRLCLRRNYAFEISLDGRDRHRGGLQMLDGRLLSWSLPFEHAPPPAAPSGSNVILLRRPPGPDSRLH
jgi:uncharacterized protein DUF3301